MTKVALATAEQYVSVDEDLPLLSASLTRLGATGTAVAWDDSTVDWAGFDLVIVRSTWDYPARHPEFLDWAARVTSLTRLMNPLPVLVWNSDKHYLRDLSARGVPVVPTSWIRPGQFQNRLPHTAEDFVVKPAVSAAGRDTARYGPDDDAAIKHIRRLLSGGRTVMLQPYLSSVDDFGEIALIYLAGEYSHSVRKGPLLAPTSSFAAGFYDGPLTQKCEPTARERQVAEHALGVTERLFDTQLLYARVDLLREASFEPVVLELELTEPSLYLRYSETAPRRLAEGILSNA